MGSQRKLQEVVEYWNLEGVFRRISQHSGRQEGTLVLKWPSLQELWISISGGPPWLDGLEDKVPTVVLWEEYGEKFGKVEAGCEQGTLQSLNFLTLILVVSILYMPIGFDVSEVEPMNCEIQEKFFHFILDTFFCHFSWRYSLHKLMYLKCRNYFWTKREISIPV